MGGNELEPAVSHISQIQVPYSFPDAFETTEVCAQTGEIVITSQCVRAVVLAGLYCTLVEVPHPEQVKVTISIAIHEPPGDISVIASVDMPISLPNISLQFHYIPHGALL